MSVFKKIIKYTLIILLVVVAINVASGNGRRAGEAIVGFGSIIALALIGWALSAIFSGLKSLSKKGMGKLEIELSRHAKSRAQDDLLRYKQLHDAGILSNDEYAAKAEELKKLAL